MKLRIHLYHYDIDNNNSYCILYFYLYILVGEEYEGFPEELHLWSKCFLDLLILREDLSPSQLSVILTDCAHWAQYYVYYVLYITVYYSFKMSYN